MERTKANLKKTYLNLCKEDAKQSSYRDLTVKIATLRKDLGINPFAKKHGKRRS